MRGGVWLSFGAYFTHFPAPPPGNYCTVPCCMLTFWLSCVNYALRGEFPLLHRLLQDIFTYALFWLIRVNLSLKNSFAPYYTISFRWNKRLLEPKFLCDECPVNLYNFFFFGEGNGAFPEPFKPRYPLTNSPNWSPYISLKNELREFDKRSKHFSL